MSRFMLLLTLLMSFSLGGCSLTRTASVTIHQQKDDLDFQFRTRGINGLLGLRLWRRDTKEVFWDVNLNYYREPHLRYGDIPTSFRTFNRASNFARQNYPADDRKPLPLPPSTSFMLELAVQYDTLLFPASQRYHYAFTTDASGIVSKVTRPEKITVEDLPKPY